MVHHVAVNDIVWYSRFAVLVGALVLVVQAAAGRAAGFITLIAIILICAGFVVFIAALALQGMGVTRLAPRLTASESDTLPAREAESSTGAVDTDSVE